MGVVTFSAAYGAAGAEVAPAVAERLGLPFHDRAIAAQVAGRLGVPVAEAEANDETVVRGWWRLVASLGTMPDPVGGVLPMAALPDARAYRQQTERVLEEIAAGAGGVVLGRAAAMVLGSGRTCCTCGWTAPVIGVWPLPWSARDARSTTFAARWRSTTGRARHTSGTSTGVIRRMRGTTTSSSTARGCRWRRSSTSW